MDQEQHEHKVFTGEILAKSVVAGSAAASSYSMGPEATILIASTAPFVEAALLPTIERMSSFMRKFGIRAVKGTEEELTEHLQQHPPAAALLADAGLAAARTDYDVKLEAIGQAISEGVLYEEGVAFDRDAMLVRMICSLDRSEVAVLEKIVRSPQGTSTEVIGYELSNLSTVVHKIVADLIALGLAQSRQPVLTEGIQSKVRRESRSGGDVLGKLTKSIDEALKTYTEREIEATPSGIQVMKRYLEAAVSINKTLSEQTENIGKDVLEYVGPVVPSGDTWDSRQSSIALHMEENQTQSNETLSTDRAHAPIRRSGWITTQQNCHNCGTSLVSFTQFYRLEGRSTYVASSGPDIRCPLGCQPT